MPLTDANDLKRKLECQEADVVVKNAKMERNVMRGKMCALLMMYSGVGYFGMQRNEGFRTIEGDLLQALYDAQVINKESFDKPSKARFQRASKTDKNVSAMGQLCSLKLPDDEDIVLKVNDVLPKQIRVIDVFRTTKSFHAKGLCKYRIYRYVSPSFAFSPRETNATDYAEYRLNCETIAIIDKILSGFTGTHNFHNFTSGRKPTDPSCNRYIMSFCTESPFVINNVEYVPLIIKGQSFMLHQIRKMIGLAISIVRGFIDDSIFDSVFRLGKIDIPKAPGLGLILDSVNFDSYNERFAANGLRKAIDWTSYKTEIDSFAMENIYSHIYKSEESDNSMATWLETLQLHSFSVKDTNTLST